MSLIEAGLGGAQVRHASRKWRPRFDRSWSASDEAWLALQEEADDGFDPQQIPPPIFEIWGNEFVLGPLLPRAWWLLIADGAGRQYFGCRPPTADTASVAGPSGEETAPATPPRPDAFEDLHQVLKDWSIGNHSSLDLRSRDQAFAALGRHPFFLASPQIGYDTPAANMLETIVAHQAFWLRDVADWNPPEGDADTCIGGLFAHLFYRYDMPPWLDYRAQPGKAWRTDPNWLPLALYVGRGGSLYRAAEYLFLDAKGRPLFTRRGIQHLQGVPTSLIVEEAVYHALVLQSGGDDQAVLDFYNYGRRPSPMFGAPVVQAVAPWLAQHRKQLAPGLSFLVIAWAFCETEKREWAAKQIGATAIPLTLKKRSVRSVLADVFKSLSCARHPIRFTLADLLRWPSHGWDRTLHLDGVAWTFREICTLNDLARESDEMNHCVFQLLGQCVSGDTILVSLTSDRGERVTLQICPLTHILLQIRGHTNRPPSPAEPQPSHRKGVEKG